MEWYFPITIIPGVGLVILSTATFTVALNNELMQLCENVDENRNIIDLKILQMKRLSISISFLYSSILLFLLSGLAGAVSIGSKTLFLGLMIGGVLFITIAIVILLIYSIKAIGIRQKVLKMHR